MYAKKRFFKDLVFDLLSIFKPEELIEMVKQVSEAKEMMKNLKDQ